MRLCFLDLETTGLDCETDEITEIAWIVLDYGGQWIERQFFVEHERLPNEWVLKNTDYVTRILPAYKHRLISVLFQLEQDVYSGREQTHLAGANPSFDDRFLRKAYYQRAKRNGDHRLDPPYQYHLVDVEAVALGALKLTQMPRLKDLRAALGLAGANDAPHTALGDAREAKLIYESIVSGTRKSPKFRIGEAVRVVGRNLPPMIRGAIGTVTEYQAGIQDFAVVHFSSLAGSAYGSFRLPIDDL